MNTIYHVTMTIIALGSMLVGIQSMTQLNDTMNHINPKPVTLLAKK